MKCAIVIEDGQTQLVLTPQSEHEKAVLRLAVAAMSRTSIRASITTAMAVGRGRAAVMKA